MIRKLIIRIFILFVILLISAFIYDYYQKKEIKENWEKYFVEYEKLWSNGSIHECSLKKVDGFVVTKTNEKEFKNSKFIVKIVDENLYLKSDTKEIQTRLITRARDSVLFHSIYQIGKDKIHPYKNSSLDYRMWNESIKLFNVYEYSCVKQN